MTTSSAHPGDPIAAAAIAIASALPPDRAHALARALANGQLHTGETVHVLETRFGLSNLMAVTISEHVRVARSADGSLVDLALATGIRSVLAVFAGRALEAQSSEPTELVWTGPRSIGINGRATYSVALEMLREAKEEIIVVGYSLTAGAGAIFTEFARAGARGLHLTLVGQRLSRQLQPLLELWPVTQRLPDLFTFEPPTDDRQAALHAKLIIADHAHMLATSANLTYHGLHGNIEVGLLCHGEPASGAVKLLRALVSARVLRPIAHP